MKITPFHLAFPVKNLKKTLPFYKDVIQCGIGRTDTHWADLDFFGHQVVLHEKEGFTPPIEQPKNSNPVDGHEVPVPHFGVVLPMEDWKALKNRVETAGVKFIIEPYVRFEGKPGEQATMFFEDPEGNALEFKAFKDLKMLFEK